MELPYQELLNYLKINDFTKMGTILRLAAEKGEPKAQLFLAHMLDASFEMDAGMPNNSKNEGFQSLDQIANLALQWYEKASAQSLSEAQFHGARLLTHLGRSNRLLDESPRIETIHHLFNQAKEANYYEAIFDIPHYDYYSYNQKLISQLPEVIIEAMDSQNPHLLYKLGVLYEYGIECEQSHKKAAYYYRLSAEKGDYAGQSNWARCLIHGMGVSPNLLEGISWHLSAAEGGNVLSQYELAKFYHHSAKNARNFQLAHHWATKAAEQSHPQALFLVAQDFELGHGTPINLDRAFHYYQQGAYLHNLPCLRHLSRCYELGIGVDINYEKAFYWALKALLISNSTFPSYRFRPYYIPSRLMETSLSLS